MADALQNLKEVDIDADGTFKYILIKVFGSKKGEGTAKTIVRGYRRCPYHGENNQTKFLQNFNSFIIININYSNCLN